VFLLAVTYIVVSAKKRPGREEVVEPGASADGTITEGTAGADGTDGESEKASKGEADSGDAGSAATGSADLTKAEDGAAPVEGGVKTEAETKAETESAGGKKG
jgi:hypothetical protein